MFYYSNFTDFCSQESLLGKEKFLTCKNFFSWRIEMTANKKGKNLLHMQYFNKKCDYCVLLTSLLIWLLSAMDQAQNEWKSNLIFNKNYEKNVFFCSRTRLRSERIDWTLYSANRIFLNGSQKMYYSCIHDMRV